MGVKLLAFTTLTEPAVCGCDGDGVIVVGLLVIVPPREPVATRSGCAGLRPYRTGLAGGPESGKETCC